MVSEEERAENFRKEQAALKAKVDLENTLRLQREARAKAAAQKKKEKTEEDEVLELMKKQ